MGEGTIGWAIKQLHNGAKCTRSRWNGSGQSIELQVPDAHSKMTKPYIFINTVDGGKVPWVASQTDLLAIDWKVA